MANKLALRLLKIKGDTTYDIYPQLKEAACLAEESNKQIQQEYSFLSYAQEYWLFHSKRFEPNREISYPLWRRLVIGSVRTVKLPWTPEDWIDLGFNFFQWIEQNDHGALLYLTFDRLEQHDPAKIVTVWEMLLKKELEFNVQGKYNGNSLFMAMDLNNDAMVRLLVEKGVALDLQDKNGQTPLLWAAAKGHEAIVQLLVQKGAALDLQNKRGQTPLSWAAEKGHEGVVRLLVEKGAALDLQNSTGQTPLSLAARKGHEAVVQLLVEKGATLDSQDNTGYTSLSWALIKTTRR
jgi:hypothetical protein